MPHKTGDSPDNINKINRDKQIKTKIKQPLFQFTYDIFSGKFIRELRDITLLYDHNKNPQFMKGYYSSLTGDLEDSSVIKRFSGK